jgi:hypothetical protein
VVDLAFFIGGKPIAMSSFVGGALNWYSKASSFSGAGFTDKNATFSYQANWAAPGRWGVEFLTSRTRYIFRPMEQLQVQKIGEVQITPATLDSALDEKFKPGLYRQTEAFLNHDDANLFSIQQQSERMRAYEVIQGLGANPGQNGQFSSTRMR